MEALVNYLGMILLTLIRLASLLILIHWAYYLSAWCHWSLVSDNSSQDMPCLASNIYVPYTFSADYCRTASHLGPHLSFGCSAGSLGHDRLSKARDWQRRATSGYEGA